MADVSFNEEPVYASAAPAAVRKRSALTALVQKLGLAKTDEGAEKVLLGIAILAAVAGVIIFINASRSPSAPPPPTLAVPPAGAAR